MPESPSPLIPHEKIIFAIAQTMDLILKAILTGFVLSIMIGPVFFVLMQTSIRKGIRAALVLDLGVLISDVVYIGIAYVFFTEITALTEGSGEHWMKIIGGVLFLAYGIYNFMKKVDPSELEVGSKMGSAKGDYKILILKGFLLNLANPAVVFYWLTVMTLAIRDSEKQSLSSPILYFVSIILITYFTIDVLKIVGAKKLRPLVTPRILHALNQLIGIVFVCFAVVLLADGILSLN